MIQQTELKEYPKISLKLINNPIKNGWIVGCLSWFIILLSIFLTKSGDLLIFSVVIPIVAYKAEKRNLSKYKNPPTLDNLYKFFLHYGIAMILLTVLYATAVIGFLMLK